MGLTEKYILSCFQYQNIEVWLSIGLVTLCVLYYVTNKRKQERNIHDREDRNTTSNFKSDENLDDEDNESSKIVPSLWDEHTIHVPFQYNRYSFEESLERSRQFYENMNGRRSLRFYSSEMVPQGIIENLIRTAGTSPSGGHTEPWTFVAIKDTKTKEDIRGIVEMEEEINYNKRMGKQWTNDLQGFRTNSIKLYITDAPWVIIVFRQAYFPLPDGRRRTHYYNEISTALATGLLLAAIQNAGLVTLTSTPLNCGPALRQLLERPSHEKLTLLLPVGYPKEGATVPKLSRKAIENIMVVI